VTRSRRGASSRNVRPLRVDREGGSSTARADPSGNVSRDEGQAFACAILISDRNASDDRMINHFWRRQASLPKISDYGIVKGQHDDASMQKEFIDR
jgi:hypothetical protein